MQINRIAVHQTLFQWL